jgi:hypothetical protein
MRKGRQSANCKMKERKKELKELIKDNPNIIVLEKDTDGNWRGYMNKFGKLVEVREVGPETALQKLLTHSGNV